MLTNRCTMKILFVHSEPDYTRGNPYVYTLVKGLQNQGCQVKCSIDHFWNNFDDYDIIHFQWPEAIFQWHPITFSDVEKLTLQLHRLKTSKKQIVYTRHNILPHYSTNKYRNKLYELIENNSDIIIHMGQYSLTQIISQKNNNNTKHFVVPHHTYDEIYTSVIDQKVARDKLKIKNDRIMFLCFGEFRNDEEREFVFKSFSKLNHPKKLLVAPRFYKYRLNINHPRAFIKGIVERVKYSSLSNKMRLSIKFVDTNLLPYYFSATDVVFIQRNNILNSGNIPLAFHFGKTVIGKDIGNVGELLRETDNILFSTTDIKTVIIALEQSIKKAGSGQGYKNKEFALKYLSTNEIARQIKEIYRTALE